MNKRPRFPSARRAKGTLIYVGLYILCTYVADCQDYACISDGTCEEAKDRCGYIIFRKSKELNFDVLNSELSVEFSKCTHFICRKCNCTCLEYYSTIKVRMGVTSEQSNQERSSFTIEKVEYLRGTNRIIILDQSNRVIYDGQNSWMINDKNSYLRKLFTPSYSELNSHAIIMVSPEDESGCYQMTDKRGVVFKWCKSLCNLNVSLSARGDIVMYPSDYTCNDEISDYNLYSNICVKQLSISVFLYTLKDEYTCYRKQLPCTRHVNQLNTSISCGTEY